LKGEPGNWDGKDFKAGSWKREVGSFWSAKRNNVLYFLILKDKINRVELKN
jgi:hypothetical protein